MNETHTPRRIAFGTLAVVLAVLLGGLGALPAHAADNKRPQAIAAANDFIADCIGNGGELAIEMEEGYGWTTVTCLYDEDYEYCFFYYDGTTSCGREPYRLVKPLPGRWDDLPILVSDIVTIDEGGTPPPPVTESQASEIESPASDEAASTPGANGPAASQGQQSAAATAQDQDQDNAKSAKGKGKKGKKGKKGGNHRKR